VYGSVPSNVSNVKLLVRRFLMSGILKVALLGTLPLVGGQALYAQEDGIGVGAAAPAVVVHDLDGKAVDLGQYIGRKPVFLEFWATWCESCEALLPRVRAAQAAYGDKVEFIGVNITVNQTPGQVRRYIEIHRPPFRTLYDDEGTSTRAFQVPATSYVVIVDKSGKIAYTGSGGTQKFDETLRRITRN
jgi:thiol-disulfide isomerase/thioredoxin